MGLQKKRVKLGCSRRLHSCYWYKNWWTGNPIHSQLFFFIPEGYTVLERSIYRVSFFFTKIIECLPIVRVHKNNFFVLSNVYFHWVSIIYWFIFFFRNKESNCKRRVFFKVLQLNSLFMPFSRQTWFFLALSSNVKHKLWCMIKVLISPSLAAAYTFIRKLTPSPSKKGTVLFDNCRLMVTSATNILRT